MSGACDYDDRGAPFVSLHCIQMLVGQSLVIMLDYIRLHQHRQERDWKLERRFPPSQEESIINLYQHNLFLIFYS